MILKTIGQLVAWMLNNLIEEYLNGEFLLSSEPKKLDIDIITQLIDDRIDITDEGHLINDIKKPHQLKSIIEFERN